MNQNTRWTIFVLYIFIAVMGAVLFGAGLFWLEFEMEYEDATEKPYIYVGAVLMALGLSMGIITLFAWYTVIKKNTRLLKIISFSSLLLVIVYADYALFAFQLRSASSPYMEDFVKDLESLFTKPGEDKLKFFDFLHRKLRCCGVNGFHDFEELLNRTLPLSCCKNQHSSCVTPSYKRGCLEAVESYVKYKFALSGFFSLAVSVLNLFISIFIYSRKQQRSLVIMVESEELD